MYAKNKETYPDTESATEEWHLPQLSWSARKQKSIYNLLCPRKRLFISDFSDEKENLVVDQSFWNSWPFVVRDTPTQILTVSVLFKASTLFKPVSVRVLCSSLKSSSYQHVRCLKCASELSYKQNRVCFTVCRQELIYVWVVTSCSDPQLQMCVPYVGRKCALSLTTIAQSRRACLLCNGGSVQGSTKHTF